MAVRYVGNVEFAEAGGPRIVRLAGEVHRLTQSWRGAAHLADAFEKTLALYAPHPARPLMWLTGWSGDGDGVFPSFDLDYVGLLGETVPEVVAENAMRLNSERIEVGGREVTMVFYTPSTTYRYYSLQRPGDEPRFKEPQRSRVVVAAPARFAGKSSFYIRYSGSAQKVFKDCFADIATDYSDEEVVPGRLWRVTETVEKQLALEGGPEAGGGGTDGRAAGILGNIRGGKI